MLIKEATRSCRASYREPGSVSFRIMRSSLIFALVLFLTKLTSSSTADWIWSLDSVDEESGVEVARRSSGEELEDSDENASVAVGGVEASGPVDVNASDGEKAVWRDVNPAEAPSVVFGNWQQWRITSVWPRFETASLKPSWVLVLFTMMRRWQ